MLPINNWQVISIKNPLCVLMNGLAKASSSSDVGQNISVLNYLFAEKATINSFFKKVSN